MLYERERYVGSETKFISVGKDLDHCYGYAVDHHTIDLWFRLWKAHDLDVRRHGTPPPCKILLDVGTSA